MERLAAVVIGLTFIVDLLLLIGTNRLLGYSPGGVRTVAAACISSVFSGVCLLPRGAILTEGIWPVVLLGIMMATAFGCSPQRWMVYLLLKFALQGAAGMLGRGSVLSAVVGGGMVAVLCVCGLRERDSVGELIPVELNYRNRQWKLTALRDTGNTLHDPLTGERVFVADANTGLELLGLTARQLSAPMETLASGLAPGMRLIPYRTVGQQGAMMLAMRMKDVKVGSWRGSAVVAFAPECFGKDEGYQMLIGGMVG